MATIDICMPAEEKEGTAASVGRWLKRLGEAVQEHEPLLEINTDKVTVEIAAPASGLLAELAKAEGDTVIPGELLGRIRSEATGIRSERSPAITGSLPSHGVVAREGSFAEAHDGYSPAVRRLLREHQLDAANIPQRGRGGRLTLNSIEAYLADRSAARVAAARAMSATETKPRMAGRLVPHTPMRRSIAGHMARSIQAAPHVTSVFEADLSAVLSDRETRRQTAESEPVPSITAYLIQAAIIAMQLVPEVNSKWHDDHIEIFDWVHFGVGTALVSGGLVVPVIREAHSMDLLEIGAALRALTEKARHGKLTQADMEGGTFTLSNHGVSGSLLAAPIILPFGQSAILGAGKLQKRVIVAETGGRELFRVRPMMYVTLTVDHRVLDAQQTNRFLTRFVEALEKPTDRSDTSMHERSEQ